jgi:L-lactate dehydrogenase complex protein LldG
MRTTADARERVLRRIGGGAGAESRTAEYRDLVAERALPIFDETDPLALFSRCFTQQQGEIHTVASINELPGVVADLVTEPTGMVLDSDPELASLDWGGQQSLSLQEWSAVRGGGVAVSRGLCAVAESGTLVCATGRGNPGSINFLADQHVVAVRRNELVRHLDDAWTLLRERLPETPRGLFLLSGPSCTADVGGIMTFGIHGPIRLHAVFVDD